MRRLLVVVAGAVLAALAGIQLVPYGAYALPSERSEPAWDSPRTRELAQRACFDCHSNETVWPWYAHVAPFSWLVRRDVDIGRAELNFSEWGRREQETGDAAESVAEGGMPPALYLAMQPKARLTASERRELLAGLAATLGGSAGEGEDDD